MILMILDNYDVVMIVILVIGIIGIDVIKTWPEGDDDDD